MIIFEHVPCEKTCLIDLVCVCFQKTFVQVIMFDSFEPKTTVKNDNVRVFLTQKLPK